MLASASADATVIIWDIKNGAQKYQLKAPVTIDTLRFCCKDKKLLAKTVGNKFILWNLNSCQVERKIPNYLNSLINKNLNRVKHSGQQLNFTEANTLNARIVSNHKTSLSFLFDSW